MSLRVGYSERAIAQLELLYEYIAEATGPHAANAFTSSIMDYCDGFATFPHRGARRDDIRPGLRIVGFRRRVTIAFTIEENAVNIVGVFYGGQDYEQALTDD